MYIVSLNFIYHLEFIVFVNWKLFQSIKHKKTVKIHQRNNSISIFS